MARSSESTRREYVLRDGVLSALHFGDVTEPVQLVFLHANGFNALSSRSFLASLDVHSVAFDMRGHGHSRHMPQPNTIANWHIFRDDCVEFFDRHLPQLADGPVVLAGHSFGAVSAILSAPYLRDKIYGYAGFDPVSVPFRARLISAFSTGRKIMKSRVPIMRNAGRRRSVFDSPEAAFERWHGRGAFRGMQDDVLRDYISDGLFKREDGQWELACDPLWEQAIFAAQWHNLFKAARSLPDNSKLIFAGKGAPVSNASTRRAVQKAQPKIEVIFDPALRHLFPFIEPEQASQALRDVLAGG